MRRRPYLLPGTIVGYRNWRPGDDHGELENRTMVYMLMPSAIPEKL